jgi:hypothetical protein
VAALWAFSNKLFVTLYRKKGLKFRPLEKTNPNRLWNCSKPRGEERKSYRLGPFREKRGNHIDLDRFGKREEII